MARGRRRGSPLWLLSVVAAVAVLALLVVNAPRHASSVAVQPPTEPTVATETTVPVDTVVPPTTRKRSAKPAATVPPTEETTPVTDLLTGEPVTEDTVAATPDTVAVTPTTTPKTVAPILAAPKPLVAHLAVTG